MRFGPGFLAGQLLDHFRQKIVRADGSTPARPVNFNLILTLRCNARCVLCHFYKKREPDLDAAVVERILGAIRGWLGSSFFVNISGGEPLMHKDIFRLIAFCRRNDIRPKIGTNGLILDPRTCDKLAEAGLEYLSVSVDSLRPEVHDSLRGVLGALDRALAGLRHLRERGLKAGVNTVISSRNAADLVLHAEGLLEEHKVARLNFQPIEPTFGTDTGFDEFRRDPLWVTDLEGLAASIRGLERLKKRRFILNSSEELRTYIRYFEDPGAVSRGRRCGVGTSNFLMDTRGEVRLCWNLAPIGSFTEDAFDPASIWNSSRARTARLESIHCRRTCTSMCYRSPSLAQKMKYLLFLR